jgi:nucleoside-diphosphate-sugar epimerase
MRVMVTGATGFVGRHVVSALIKRGHSVVAVSRGNISINQMQWIKSVAFIQCDIQQDFEKLLAPEILPEILVHLAWPGLPNYKDFFHISKNLPSDLKFLEAAVNAGVKHLVVAGTCLEYGLVEGALTEEMDTHPTTPYGFAKDALRKSLQFLQNTTPFTLQWMRLFYMYGEGQNSNSLLSQLDRAIDENNSVFNMSQGDQLRDYLPVEHVAEQFCNILENAQCEGVINCCSGKGLSVFDLVKKRAVDKGSSIKFNRGFYPHPEYEPFSFWGVSSKLNSL